MLCQEADPRILEIEDDLKAVTKPQYVDQLPKAVKSTNRTVGHLITARSEMENLEEILDVLGLSDELRLDQ